MFDECFTIHHYEKSTITIITILFNDSLHRLFKKIEYDEGYGIQYCLNENTFIRIHLDPNDSKTISKLWIVSSDTLMKDGKGMEAYPTNGNEEVAITYEKTDTQESIIVRFYLDIKEDDLKALNSYLGYAFTAKNDVHDLLESDTFTYKQIFDQGEFLNDISFAGNRPVKL